MAASIDNLNIEITASAGKAVKSINQLADALKSLAQQLNSIDTSNLTTATQAVQGFSQAAREVGRSARSMQRVTESMQQLGSQANNVTQAAEASAEFANAAESAAQAVDTAAEPAEAFASAVNQARSAAQGATASFSQVATAVSQVSESAGSQGASGFSRFQQVLFRVRDGFSGFKQGVVDVKNVFKNFLSDMLEGTRVIVSFGDRFTTAIKNMFPHTHKAASGMRRFRSESQKTALTSKGLAKELLRVSKMLKLMITRMALRAVIKEVGDGFKSLALHSAEFDASMSSLINGSKKLGYSFAGMVSPLINALAPALTYIINLLIKFVNILNQVFSALTGSATWNKAKDFTEKWSDDIEASNKQAKELKKTVLGFDELNQLQEKYTSGGDTSNNIVDMFETVAVENKWKSLANDIKKYFDKILAPIKKAWANAGDYVKSAWVSAFESVKNLVMDIADDFLEVWTQPKTVRMLENILKIIGNIGTFVSNIADSFDRAWKKGDVGKHIFEDIRDLCFIIVEYVEKITASWADWAAIIDFSPLLESTEEWLKSLQKPVNFLMGVFEDLNTKYIQPLTKYLVESGIPDLIQGFTDFNNKVDWDLLHERFGRIISALESFSEALWGGFVMFISDVADALAIGLNSEAMGALVDVLVDFLENVNAQDVYNACELIVNGFLLYKSLAFLGTAVQWIAKLVGWIKICAPMLVNFGAYIAAGPEGWVIGFSELWDKYGEGSFLDSKTWEGALKKISDTIYIFCENVFGYVTAFVLAPFMEIPYYISEAFNLGWYDSNPLDDYLDEMTHSLWEYYDAVNLLEANGKSIAGSVDEVISRAKTTSDAVSETSTDIQTLTDDALAPYINMSEDAQKASANLAEEQRAVQNATQDATSAAKGLTGQYEDVKKATDLSKTSVEGLENYIRKTDDTSKTSTENMKKNYSSASNTIQGELKTLERNSGGLFDSIKKMFGVDNWTFKGISEGLGKSFTMAKSVIKGIWNSISESLSGTYSFFGHDFSINLPKMYARGGFPEDGLFMANHGEMVGRFSNGKTAVANNEQITAGIAQAVYSAMLSANSGGGGSYINNTIEIDGVAIARAVTKGQRTLDRRYSPTMA